jgi:GAF domain-containing protein
VGGSERGQLSIESAGQTSVATDAEPVTSSDDDVWRLATALSGAATAFDVAVALAEEGAGAAGASFANMAMLDLEGNRLRVVHGSTLEPDIAARWSSFPLTEQTPLCEAVRTGRPVLLGSVEVIQECYPNLWVDTVASGFSATASLPMRTADGAALGAVGFGWREPQAFDSPPVRRRLDLIAQLAAQALDRALLYERERGQPSARERAEAHLLQEAFLPRELPDSDNLELAAAYLPARDAAMGGDWYDAFPVQGGTCLVIGAMRSGLLPTRTQRRTGFSPGSIGCSAA